MITMVTEELLINSHLYLLDKLCNESDPSYKRKLLAPIARFTVSVMLLPILAVELITRLAVKIICNILIKISISNSKIINMANANINFSSSISTLIMPILYSFENKTGYLNYIGIRNYIFLVKNEKNKVVTKLKDLHKNSKSRIKYKHDLNLFFKHIIYFEARESKLYEVIKLLIENAYLLDIDLNQNDLYEDCSILKYLVEKSESQRISNQVKGNYLKVVELLENASNIKLPVGHVTCAQKKASKIAADKKNTGITEINITNPNPY